MKILISGGGIAGMAAALYLHKSGHELTIIDKAASFQKLGYAISLKYFGLELLKDLELFDELKKHELSYKFLKIYDSNGKPLQQYSQELIEKMAIGSILMLRSDLHEVLYSAVIKKMPIRFGTQIREVVRNDTQAQVVFTDGKSSTFDMVIVAEGLRSSTRKLLWKDEGYQKYDVMYAAANIEREHGFKPGITQMYMGAAKTLIFFSITEKQMLVQSYFRGMFPRDETNHYAKNLLLETFKNFPQKTTKLVESISSGNYIFYDNVDMITLPTLFKGRFALLGDAGYCTTFLSGMGASLGILGAKALARSLQEFQNSPEQGLQKYNALMQPIIDHYQKSAKRNIQAILTPSPIKSAIRNFFIRLLPPFLAAKFVQKEVISIENNLLQKIMAK